MSTTVSPVAGDPIPVPAELVAEEGNLPRLWGRRGFWQVRLRWLVAPLMLAGVLCGLALGFEFPVTPILLIAGVNLLYNTLFAYLFSRWSERLAGEPRLDRIITSLEVLADYLAMFLLVYCTGGVSSPLAVLLIFHVVIAAIQFRAGKAYQYAALAAGGLWVLFAGQFGGWLPAPAIAFRGQPVHFLDRPVYAALQLAIFSATLFVTALLVGRIMAQLRRRVAEVARTSTQLAARNAQFSGLYAMVAEIGAQRRLEPILDTVSAELASVLDVPAVAVKLLAEDGKTLRYVAGSGLPRSYLEETVIDLEESPLNRRVIEGETVVHSRGRGGETIPLGRTLTDLGIRSSVLAPLEIEEKVIGTLGAYSDEEDRFLDEENSFLVLVAELVAIAIEDARANEAVESLVRERTEFMLRVAHNLRAPLAAALSMLELLGEDQAGELTPQQGEYLERVQIRLRALDTSIGELLTIARARDWTREIPDVVVDLNELAVYARRTFGHEAERKGLRYEVEAEEDLPSIASGGDLLEKLIDNLVSNAIKYTPSGGEVKVELGRRGAGEVRIMVGDTGIGIPSAEQQHLFEEFFRAGNARKMTPAGTGLGLALVKRTVERHRGRIMVASEEGQGTTVVVDLPLRRDG